MKTVATVLRRFVLALACVFSCGGISFALAYAFEDPGGWAAAAQMVAVLVPFAALTVLAFWAPDAGLWVLRVAVVLFAAWTILNELVDIVDAPDIPLIALVLAAPTAVVGQWHPTRAGWLLAAMAAVPLSVVLVRTVEEPGPEGVGLGDLLTTSTGVVIVPLVLMAAVLLAAGRLAPPPVTRDDRPIQPPPAAGR